MPTKPICADIIMCSAHLFLFAQAFSHTPCNSLRVCHTRFCKWFIQLWVLSVSVPCIPSERPSCCCDEYGDADDVLKRRWTIDLVCSIK